MIYRGSKIGSSSLKAVQIPQRPPKKLLNSLRTSKKLQTLQKPPNKQCETRTAFREELPIYFFLQVLQCFWEELLILHCFRRKGVN